MYKRFNIFSFLILSALWANSPLQAIGGMEVEEVPADEIKRRGILKIRHPGAIVTGVLFQEGKGWLGLSAKHCLNNFHPVTYPIIACLGEEKRNVVKVYTPEDQGIDLALFVLSSPFSNGEEFPTLPRALPTASIYEGDVYGYGCTTSSIHPSPLEASWGTCRKGKVFITPSSKIEPDTHRFMRRSKRPEPAGDDFISFSGFPTEKKADLPFIEVDPKYQFSKSTLERGYVPLGAPDDRLLISPSVALGGDSGGPVIGADNQIYALYSGIYPNIWPAWVTGSKDTLLERSNNKAIEHFKFMFFEDEVILGFLSDEGSTLYFSCDNKSSYSPEKVKTIFSKINNMITKNITEYYTKDMSQFFSDLLKIEEKLIGNCPTTKPYFSQWLANIHHYNIGYFTSLFSNRDWIENTMSQAFQDVEQQPHTPTECSGGIVPNPQGD